MTVLCVAWGGGSAPARPQTARLAVQTSRQGAHQLLPQKAQNSKPPLQRPSPVSPQHPCPAGADGQQPLHELQRDVNWQNPCIEDRLEDLADVDDTPLAVMRTPAMQQASGGCHLSGQQNAGQPWQPEQPFLSPQDRMPSGGNGDWNTSGSRGRSRDEGASADGAAVPTELIFRLERRGQGWGEEIFPHLVVENRPIDKPRRDRPRSAQPDPWQASHLQHLLIYHLGSRRAASEQHVCS